jgi:hypothetical protein
MTIQKFYGGFVLLDVDHNPWGCFLTSFLLVHMFCFVLFVGDSLV